MGLVVAVWGYVGLVGAVRGLQGLTEKNTDKAQLTANK